ncbi:hypothetical protein DOK67_0002539 [Enterococcus sp. DIV0212c]|uniref:Ig-like domain-containing protein n=1 Tax=Enterococcus sp. DIV0212c TaxID=2230867 RepID=UPI001A9ABE37|nr:WxL domain-containing protein [Enterococcus sp. DIV0212c]MBO1353531.1 WxL domain-containing protein [Enterococcus sp. DIV0212c]
MLRTSLAIALMAVFSTTLFIRNNNHKNYSFNVKAAEKENLLKSTEWDTYAGRSDHSWKATSTLKNIKVIFNTIGAVQVTDERVYIKKNAFEIGSYNDEPIILKQPVALSPDRYYQFQTTVGFEWSQVNPDKRFNIYIYINGDKAIKNLYINQVNPSTTQRNVKLNFKALQTSNEIVLEASSYRFNGFSNQWAATSMFQPTLTDITENVIQIGSEIDALFTDSNLTALKLNVTQKELTDLRNRLTDYKELLDATEWSKMDIKLTKAQNLLNAVVQKLTVEDLVDNQQDSHSQTISGTTYPNAFLNFSGHPAITEGNLTSEVAFDTRKYQMRADDKGDFSYSLAGNSHFKFGDKITIVTALHGKELSQVKMVLDTTPPNQPTLEKIQDVASAFTGEAEKEATIKVYDSSTDIQPFLEGKADADNHYSLTIPEEKRPLVPYRKYYVTATDASGNISKQSSLQEVADTLPPKADSVKQILELGEALPDLTTLYQNLNDNAGSNNVTASLTKEPILGKVGFTTAEVTLKDKAQNKFIVIVPIFVKDKQTLDDGQHMFFAKDISVLAIDFPSKQEEQREYLIKNSQAGVWNMETGENELSKLVIEDSELSRKPGTYEVEFHVGKMSQRIKVTLHPGNLSFGQSTNRISYGTTTIKSTKQVVFPQTKVEYLVKDTRFTTMNWRLVAQLSKPLQLSDGEKTLSYLSVRKKNSDGKETKQILSDQMSTELYATKKSGNGESSIRFNEEDTQTILLEVLPGSVRSDKEYQTEIFLTLEDGP